MEAGILDRKRAEREAAESDAEATAAVNATPDRDREPPLPGEDPAEAELAADAADEVTQLSIEGDSDLTTKIGGGKPDQASIVIQGGEYVVRGGFSLEGRVCMIIEGEINEVAIKTIKDSKTKQVASRKRKHVLTPDRMEKAPLGTTTVVSS